MVSILFSGQTMTMRNEGETIDDHIKRHHEDEMIRNIIRNENYLAQQEAIEEKN